jgi:hypothetical protein
MSVDAIEQVIRESANSSPETLGEAVDQLQRLKTACRHAFVSAPTALDEQAAVELLAAIGMESEP